MPEDRSIGELTEALRRRELAIANRDPRIDGLDDPAAWPRVDRLAELVQDRAGRPLDWDSIVGWVQPRLGRCGEPRPESLSIARAVEVIGGSTDLVCGCGRPLEDRHWDSVCQRCRDEHKATYEATMGPLVQKAAFVAGGVLSEADFVAEVDPEIRHLAATKFGHQNFGMDTWVRLLDWLAAEHSSEGDVAKMLRGRVVELLRGKCVPTTTVSSAGEDYTVDVEFGAIVLRGKGNPPLVFGKEVKRLSPGQYGDIRALVQGCIRY